MRSQAIVPVAQPAVPAQLPADLAALVRQMAFEGARAYAEAQARAAVASGERKADIPIEEAVARFVRDLRAGKSPLTAQAYRAGLRRFLAYLVALGPERRPRTVAALTVDHAVDFTRALLEQQPRHARCTVHLYSTAVSRLFAFLLREGYRGAELALPLLTERLKPVRGRPPKFRPRVPEDAAVDAIIATACHRPAGDTPLREVARLRDIAYVECLRSTGGRVAELVGLRRGDLHTTRSEATVLGKGEKERAIYFDAAAWAALQAYLEARDRAIPRPAVAEQLVFASHHHAGVSSLHPLTTKGARDVLRVLVREAGQQDSRITPHRFRAWFATHLLEGTGDLALVQDALGHADPATTRAYTTVSSRRLREAHARVFDGEAAGT